MVIVGVASEDVEGMLAGGVGPGLPSSGVCCPLCGGELGPFGRKGYPRYVRAGGVTRLLRVLRAVCRGCRVTHALLPDCLCPRRRDLVETIGAALEGAAAGVGHRRLALLVGVPETTVRGWLRRVRARAVLLRASLLRLAGWLGAEAPRPPPVAEPLVWLVAAVVHAHASARARFGRGAVSGGLWAFASAAVGGTLLGYTDPPW
jgi:Domain of unknown function (DUF6431)